MSGEATGLEGMPVVVLGAGRGRRMGGPKSLMLVEGRAWWMWQNESLRGYGLDAHWVVSAQVAGSMQVSGNAPARAVIGDGSAPMFASVLLGLAGIEDLTRGVFLLPVDTPAPRISVWRLIAACDVPAHPTCGGRGGHPLFLPGEWLEAHLGTMVREAREAGVGALGHACRLDKFIEGTSRRVEVDDPAVIVNMNEPADVESWLKSDRRC